MVALVGTERLVGFSDAVFAIAATIKIVPLKLEFPLAEGSSLAAEIYTRRFGFMMFFVSFAVTMLLWENHVLLFRRLDAHCEVVTWLNLLLLSLVSFLPYPLTIMSDYHYSSAAIIPALVVVGCIALVQLAIVCKTAEGVPGARRRRFAPFHTKHDAAIAVRIGAKVAVFLLAYLLSFATYYITFALLLLLPMSNLATFWLERRWLGLNPPLERLLGGAVAVERIAFLSDGAFSIVSTLIVLDIDDDFDEQVVNGTSIGQLVAAQAPQFMAYVLSAMMVALIWTSNLSIMAELQALDAIMRYLHMVVLACTGFIPFVSGILRCIVPAPAALCALTVPTRDPVSTHTTTTLTKRSQCRLRSSS